MGQRITFDYFYGAEADQYCFYRIPKLLFLNDVFKELSSDAKILYGLLLDRMSLSVKNQWLDEENRAYIYYSIEEVMEMLNCGRNKAIKSMQELDAETGMGLIEKKRQGMGKSNVIYVKTFLIREEAEMMPEETGQEFTDQTSGQKEEKSEVYNVNFKKFKKQTSRSPENKLQEVYISNPSYTYSSNTEYNNIYKSHHILSGDEKRKDENDTYQAYQQIIRENICLKDLLLTHSQDEKLIRGIYDLILETVMCDADTILISSNRYPAALVKSKFLKLKYQHIVYVLECLQKNTSKVKNMKKYLLAVLFNASATMDGYYQAEVNYYKAAE